MTVGAQLVSYLAGALAFGVLTLFIAMRSRTQGVDRIFFVACIFSTVWAAIIATVILPWQLSALLEIARDASWVYFLLRLNQQGTTSAAHAVGRRSLFDIASIAIFGLLIAVVLMSYGLPDLVSRLAGQSIITGGLICSSVIGMQLIEKLFRGISSEDRWGLKFACIGLGTLFAYDFYLYTDALLFRHINADIWIARGLVNALIVPLLMSSFSRNPKWLVRLVVSRRMLYQSATLLGASFYLLTVAGAGYYFRYVGGSWGTILQVALGFAAAIGLITILISGTVRSRLRVFISKNFYQHGYDYREEWLRVTRTISQPGPDLEQRTISAIAELVESPGGILFIKNEVGQFVPVASTNLPLPEGIESAASPFIRLLREEHWVIDLVEFQSKPERYDGVSAMPEWLTAIPRAWLVVPLIVQADLFGFIVLYKSRSPVKLNWEVLDILKIAGSQAAGGLAQKQAMSALTIARQFESFNRMSTFVVHDLKNMVSQLSLLVANSVRHKASVEFQDDMVATVSHSVDRMNNLLQKFSTRSGIDRQRPLNLREVIARAVASKAVGTHKADLVHDADDVLVMADPVRLERVLGHLIQNAIEASASQGNVTIVTSSASESVTIAVSDSGCGMTSEFIAERLFKPFESTKPAGMGIGVFESREYVEEIGGTIRVLSELGVGSTFHISLPVYRDSEMNIAVY